MQGYGLCAQWPEREYISGIWRTFCCCCIQQLSQKSRCQCCTARYVLVSEACLVGFGGFSEQLLRSIWFLDSYFLCDVEAFCVYPWLLSFLIQRIFDAVLLILVVRQSFLNLTFSKSDERTGPSAASMSTRSLLKRDQHFKCGESRAEFDMSLPIDLFEPYVKRIYFATLQGIFRSCDALISDTPCLSMSSSSFSLVSVLIDVHDRLAESKLFVIFIFILFN